MTDDRCPDNFPARPSETPVFEPKYRHGDSNPGPIPARPRKPPASRKQTKNGKTDYSAKVENREHGNLEAVFATIDPADTPALMAVIDRLSELAHTPAVVVPRSQ